METTVTLSLSKYEEMKGIIDAFEKDNKSILVYSNRLDTRTIFTKDEVIIIMSEEYESLLSKSYIQNGKINELKNEINDLQNKINSFKNMSFFQKIIKLFR